MPIPVLSAILNHGPDSVPFIWPVLKTAPCLALLWVLKTYSGGARNTAERDMHSKVVLMTGATSGIGARIAYNLATRGAQLVILTQHSLNDPFLVDHIEDLRTQTGNELITAEQVDLSSLHSVRIFATKWIDNSPPRRLDMIILCASTMTPKGSHIRLSDEGVESNFAINYLSNFHLLSILSPAIRAQPADRDVRIIFGTCSSYMGGLFPESIPVTKLPPPGSKKSIVADNPSAAFASSKLALMTFASAFQKHIANYKRPDKQPMNARVIMVDPGWTRTPSMRRYLSFGTLTGLALYLIMWPIWWLILKSPELGAQTFLYAAMEADFGRGEGGKFLKECLISRFYKDEVEDEDKQRQLWEISEQAIEQLEKESALRRATAKKEAENGKHEKEMDDEKVQTEKPKEKQPGSRRSRKAVH